MDEMIDSPVCVVAGMVAALDGTVWPSETVVLRSQALMPRPDFPRLIEKNYPVARILSLADSGQVKESEVIRIFVEMAMDLLEQWDRRSDPEALRRAFVLWTAMAVADGKLCSVEMRALDALRRRLGLAEDALTDIRNWEILRGGLRAEKGMPDADACVARACDNLSRSAIGQMVTANERADSVVLTAYRQSRDHQENRRLHAALGERLRKNGFATYPVEGAYAEERSGRKADEESWFVVNTERVPDFIARMAAVCEAEEQDSMLVIPQGRFKTGVDCYLYGTSPAGTRPGYHERSPFGTVFLQGNRWVFLSPDLV